MDSGFPLNLVFRHVAAANEAGGLYEVVHFYSSAGPVPWGVLDEAGQKACGRALGTPPSVETLEELKAFALAVCQAVGAPEVFLVSVPDYNIGVESARDLRAFREIFRRYGVAIPNAEVIGRPQGLMGRFFRK